MILGITIGVAVIVAIDLANASSARAMQLSTESLAGRATHQIISPPEGLDESIYVNLVKAGINVQATPMVTGIVTSIQLGDQPLQLLGIDPFDESAFRDYFNNTTGFFDQTSFQFFTQPGAVIISKTLAEQYQKKPGDIIHLDYAGKKHQAYIAGLLTPNDISQIESTKGTILADISTAQEILGKEGILDRIDLVLPKNASELISEINSYLPSSTHVSTVDSQNAGLSQLTAAFHTNLTALSFLAILVGLFLIYNTMTFSVIQRRALFGIYRCLGVTRREIFLSVLMEAAVIGTIGGGLGILVGIGLGQFTIKMVSQTINDLYFTTTVNAIDISISSLIKGFFIGLIASILTTIPPALEAASVPPREAMSRFTIEHHSRQRIWWVGIFGCGAFLIAWLLLLIPSKNLILGFASIGAVTIGSALITSLVLVGFLKLTEPLFTRILGLTGKLAPRNIINSLSRTSVAVSALMVSIAVSIGVGLMISSFRDTVDKWLRTSLLGDIYITAPAFISNQPTLPIDQGVLPYLHANPIITSIYLLKINTVGSNFGDIQVAATDNSRLPFERIYQSRQMPKDQIWTAMENGSIMVTESLAYRLGIPLENGYLDLKTNLGMVRFPIVGTYFDYASTSGTVQMALDVYQKYWNDRSISAIGIHIKSGVDAATFTNQLIKEMPTQQLLEVRPNENLRKDVMVVFDRTFAITRALQLLAIIVAFIGILSALGLLQFERQREMGIIRALGLTNREVWSLAMLETFLMGLVAGLMAIPTGYTLAVILTSIINQRSFGWSMQLVLTAAPIYQAVLVAILAALLAGIFPAWRMSRMQAVEAIRYE